MVQSRKLIVSALVASLLGIAQCYIFFVSWPYVAAYDPIPAWLIALGLRGNTLFAGSCLLDLTVNTLLAVPVAFVLVALLRPRKVWLYVVLAFCVALGWLHAAFGASISWTSIFPLLGILASAWAVSLWRSKPAPNNSFKPKPLRGSA
jgi:hypothetical protein